MFKALLMALAIAFTTSLFAQSKAATEAWVANYVSNQVSSIAATMKEESLNGVRSLSISENGNNITAKIEEPSVTSLVLKEVSPQLTSKGIYDGMLFPFIGDGLYRNKSNSIQATATNLILNAIYHSREVGGRCYFSDGENIIAKVNWTMLQPSIAAKINQD